MKKFLGSAGFLAAAGVISKLLGAVHKLPLMAMLGAEGTGLYHLVFPMFAAVLAVTSGGVTQAVSRSAAREGGCAPASLKAGLVMTVFAGTAGSLFLGAASGIMAKLQGNHEAACAYLALAPAVLPSCVIAALRGWWQGRRNMFPTAVSQLAEQTVKLFAGLALAYALRPRGIEYAVAGAIGGITVSEFAAAAALLAAMFAASKRPTGPVSFRPALISTVKDALPGSLSSLVMPLLQLIDSVMIVNLLIKCGAGTEGSTALYGVSAASVGAVSGMPPVFTAAYSAALLPRLCGREDEYAKRRAAGNAMSAAFLAGIAGAAIMYAFADEIVGVLYPSGLEAAEHAAASDSLRLSASGTLCLCLLQTVTTVLQSQGRAYIPALILLGSGALKACLTAVLVPVMGVQGSAAATSAAYAAALCADAAAARGIIFGGTDIRNVLKSVAAVAAGCAAGVAAKSLPVEGCFGTCFSCGAVFLLTSLLVLLATDAFGIMGMIEEKVMRSKLFGGSSAKNSKKY